MKRIKIFNERLDIINEKFDDKIVTLERKLNPKISKPKYKFDKRRTSLHNAEANCVGWGGHLVTINSMKENDFI